MAFNVQNDDGTVVDANAYIDEAYFRAYWADKNVDVSAMDQATIEGLIVEATQYIDQRFTYNGFPLNGRDQTTSFPRSGLCDKNGYEVTGIPREVKQSCAEYAYAGQSNPLSAFYSAEDQNIKSEMNKVSVLEERIEYNGAKVSASTWSIYQLADTMLTDSGFVNQYIGSARA